MITHQKIYMMEGYVSISSLSLFGSSLSLTEMTAEDFLNFGYAVCCAQAALKCPNQQIPHLFKCKMGFVSPFNMRKKKTHLGFEYCLGQVTASAMTLALNLVLNPEVTVWY